MNTLKKSKLFLVLTIHRSGSSAVAGVLNILGVHMGQNLLQASPANAKGCFENINFILLNEKILEIFNVTWGTPCSRREMLISKEQLIKSQHLLHTSQFFNNEIKPIWGLKDPRIILTFDIWKPYLEAFSEVTYIFVWRSLEESIKSLSYRDNISLIDARNILNIYYKNLIYYKNELMRENKDVIDIHFEDLLKEPEIFIEKINHRMNMYYGHNLNQVKEFLDKDLKHF
ncbi:sulfotransferase family protein [Bacillus cereus]|uniref:Sulfotransferase family protein n=1 Tax=Bacillus cereus TaxID=1396 RepID=A0A2B9DFT0_BACCE|nr:sulfotransferase family protein [Bacillus cereus]PGM86346.1 sulfotransferase family protein [Bacillus cereus]